MKRNPSFTLIMPGYVYILAYAIVYEYFERVGLFNPFRTFDFYRTFRYAKTLRRGIPPSRLMNIKRYKDYEQTTILAISPTAPHDRSILSLSCSFSIAFTDRCGLGQNRFLKWFSVAAVLFTSGHGVCLCSMAAADGLVYWSMGEKATATSALTQ